MGFAPLAVRIRANLQCNFSPAYLASPALSGETHLAAMTRVTLEAIQRLPPSVAAESLERVGNVGHRGQLRAVMTHRCAPTHSPRRDFELGGITSRPASAFRFRALLSKPLARPHIPMRCSLCRFPGLLETSQCDASNFQN